ALVSVVAINRVDGAIPRPVEFLQQLLGRRDPARDEFLDRPEIMRLVMTGPIVPATAREPLLGEPQRRLGDIEHATLPDAGLEAELRHLVAQPLALLGGPVLNQVPGRVKRSLIVEEPDPKGPEGRQPPPPPAGG